MIITLTGTPGTGKSTVAEKIKGFKVINLTRFAKEKDIGIQKEEYEIEIPEMIEKLEKEVSRDKDTIIEGHLAHYFPSDYCIVLRCHPEKLRERLELRNYEEKKIEENILSEKLDSILIKAVENQERIIEIDTTNKTPLETVKEIEKRLENNKTGYGEIDWSQTI